MSDSPTNLNACGCCEGITPLTPASLENPPGRSALACRVGTHATFKATMLAMLAQHPALRGLTTRDDDDSCIALLDAWATVLDVLTFYQERIANEGYLRTAQERRSVLELARSIGYELRPGVAASTYLAFELESATGSPGFATIDIGTKVQSVPGPNETPQTFETIEKFEARAAWNALKPKLTEPQIISTTMESIYVKGVPTSLKVGDALLIVESATQTKVVEIVRLVPDATRQRTRIDVGAAAPKSGAGASKPSPMTPGKVFTTQKTLDQQVLTSEILNKEWRESDLQTLAKTQRWSLDDIKAAIKAQRQKQKSVSTGVFSFKIRAALFGHNAPEWKALAKDTKSSYVGQEYRPNIDKEWPYSEPKTSAELTQIQLDAVYNQIKKDSWVVVERPGLSAPIVAKVSTMSETVAAGYTMSTNVTLLELNQEVHRKTLNDLRQTTVLAQSEALELDEVPILTDVKEKTLDLDQMVTDLQIGQLAALIGECSNLDGVMKSEVVVLDDISHPGGYTRLTFKDALQYSYKRDTVTLNANVVRATHGETKQKVLGSGDASQAFQKFVLPDSPLTYTPSVKPGGAATTLEIRLNDLLWTEVQALYARGSREQVYITRIGDDGKVTVEFGDGLTGARIATGTENVTAKYRAGIGRSGLVKAGQLTLLMTRPLGVKAVTNPLAPSGAADPETRDKARKNAPFTVRTLDRIVSLDDYEDYARTYAGIGKAAAGWLWQNGRWIVEVTIAGQDGALVDSHSDLYKNLKDSLAAQAVPHQSFVLVPYTSLTFDVAVAILVKPEYTTEKVWAAVRDSLLGAFSFEQRSFGQTAQESEILAVVQAVTGVEAADLVNPVFKSPPVAPTELLTINANGITLSEMPK